MEPGGGRRVRQREQPLQRPGGWVARESKLPTGHELLPGPPNPPSVAELSQDSTALSMLGTAGENRAASKPPLRASGGSSSASLASLRLPDLRCGRGPGMKRGCHWHWPLTSEPETLSQPQFSHFSLV